MFSKGYKRYVLGALSAVYMLNLVDRGLIALLLQPIKEDLQLTDTQLGFLTGIAFGLFYAVLGVPIARWADRGNRVTITSLAISLWGLTAMSFLLIGSFAQLLMARIAAAVGESGCKPPTYSLLGDYFRQPAERTRAMGIYSAANSSSTLISFILGGWLNELYGWRMAFFVMGVPALALAILVKCTVREPRFDGAAQWAAPPLAPSFAAVAATLWRSRSCRHLTFALVILYTVTLGLNPWYASFMIRVHHVGTAELGLWLGLISGLGGVLGAIGGGYAAARWFSESQKALVQVSSLAVASIAPFVILSLTAAHKDVALLALMPMTMVLGAFLGPTYALMQQLVPDTMRATMMSLIMLLANVIGFGLGPQAVGLISDLLAPSFGIDSLRYAMIGMSSLTLWGAYHYWQVSRTIARDLDGGALHDL